MLISANSKLVMIGNSITDAKRLQEIDDLPAQELGYGYVSFVAALLGSTHPDLGIKVINRGISGNTVRDLKQRWQKDVLDLKPDWLSIMIGINDVWRQFDSSDWPKEKQVYIDEYNQTLDELLTQTLPITQGIVLLAPYYIEPNHEDPMRIQMDAYGEKMRELADKHKTIFVDTQAAFDEALATYDPPSLAEDKIHPNQVGHMIIARAFLNALGFSW